MEADDSPVKCGIFVGPVTLQEIKWRLTNKNYKPPANRRHTVHGTRPCGETGMSEEFENQLEDAMEENSVVYVDSLEDSSATERLCKDISVITLSSDDEMVPPKEVSNGERLTFRGELKREKTDLDEGKPMHTSDVSVIFPNGYETHSQEEESCSDFSRTHKEVSDVSCNNSRSETDFQHDDYNALSSYSRETSCSEHDSFPEQQFGNYKQNTQYSKPKKKRCNDKYDYLISKVGQYIKQKPMPPPSTPVMKQPKMAFTSKSQFSKTSKYNSIVSPLAIYIKSGATAALIQKGTPTPVNRKENIGTKSESKIPVLSTIPKVVYKPAQNKLQTGSANPKLPSCIKKLLPQNGAVTHKARIGHPELVNITQELEKTDISSVDCRMWKDDISVLSIKDAYAK